MRVLTLTTCYPREAGDFAGSHVERGVRRILALGHATTVVTPADDGAVEATFDGGAEVVRVAYLPRRFRTLPYGYGGIPVHLKERPIRILQVPFLLAGLALATLRRASAADVLHANWLFTAIAALPAKLLARRPLLVTLRGSDMALAEANALTRLGGRIVLRLADGVAPVSEDLAVRARALGASPESTWVVADGAETEGFPARSAARETLGLPDDRPILLFVGNVIPVKGIDVLVDALAELPADARPFTVLVGGGDGIAGYRSQARAHGLNDDAIRFVGLRPTDEIPTWLAAADLFCLPSRSEGLPNALLEAMGAARPAIVTAVGGMPTLVEDGASGLVVPSEDTGALAGAIATLVADAPRRARMGELARAILGERGLTWEATATRYEELYRRLVRGNAGE